MTVDSTIVVITGSSCTIMDETKHGGVCDGMELGTTSTMRPMTVIVASGSLRH